MADSERPVILMTGAAGDVGTALARAFAPAYRVVGLDREGRSASVPLIAIDLASDDSVVHAFEEVRRSYGSRVASVIHLAAYFDFSGEDNPLYQQVNVAGTRRLLRVLQTFDVEQFVYSGTMLVHRPAAVGERIDERTPLEPKWAYPRSKAEAEQVIRDEHGRIPYVLLHLAGLYDEQRCVPTLAHQIARIYERDLKSYLYAGNPDAGQSMLHKDDMVDAFLRAVARRRELPEDTVILVGEPDALGYDALQDRIGQLIHGEAEWTTLRVPKPIAKAGAALEEKLEPAIPDALDRGEKPFIRPFMISMADDHYALDITRARRLLGWEPRHRIEWTLPALIENLKRDPLAWYQTNAVTPPDWMEASAESDEHAESLRASDEAAVRTDHRRYLWAPFLNIALGTWLVTAPALLELDSTVLALSDMVAGLLLMLFGAVSLSWRFSWSRWICAAIGLWVLFAPILFWAPTAAGYLNDTLVGALVIGLAIGLPPEPGVSPIARMTGPLMPPGWTFNPSAWTQRVLIIALAFVGLYVSRYLAAYQLGHIDGVWDPFFLGGPGPKNGSEEIVTSSVSQAWPVSDAGVGAITYMLEIVTGLIGSQRRWRTMPWLVLLFGLMIVPLGVVSIFFIIIQPIWIGTWCALCLLAAAAMLVQIPYSVDEVLATCQFLRRRHRAGRPWLHVLLKGDTDDGDSSPAPAEFERPPAQIMRDMLGGGVNVPWNLALCIAIGVWLMFTRLTLDAQGAMANPDHLIGSIAITVSVIACAEVARSLRLLNIGLGIALFASPFMLEASGTQTIASLVCGIGLIAASVRRGPVRDHYAGWDRCIR